MHQDRLYIVRFLVRLKCSKPLILNNLNGSTYLETQSYSDLLEVQIAVENEGRDVLTLTNAEKAEVNLLLLVQFTAYQNLYQFQNFRLL